MEFDGLIIDKISPKFFFKQAFQAGYITHIDSWLTMCNDRNLMYHTYDFEKSDTVLHNLQADYYLLLSKLYTDLIKEQRQSKFKSWDEV